MSSALHVLSYMPRNSLQVKKVYAYFMNEEIMRLREIKKLALNHTVSELQSQDANLGVFSMYIYNTFWKPVSLQSCSPQKRHSFLSVLPV